MAVLYFIAGWYIDGKLDHKTEEVREGKTISKNKITSIDLVP